MTIAITGATGQLGQLVIEALKKTIASDEIVALARSPHKASGLGVAVRAADYDDPGSLRVALAGVDTLLLISSNEVGRRVPQHRNAIEAAKAAGVRGIVYTSVLHADVSPLGLAEEHRQTEALLAASGLQITLLRNGWYTENYTGSIGAALANGAFVGSAGDGRISSAARADYAEAAAVVLAEPAHAGKTFELAGDDAYTLADLAAEISRQSGKTIAYRDLPEGQYSAILLEIGLPQAVAEMIASSDISASRGALAAQEKDLSRLIGRATTPMKATVADALAELG